MPAMESIRSFWHAPKGIAPEPAAQKMLYELLLRRKMDHEAEKAKRPGWGYRHGNDPDPIENLHH